MPYIGNAVITGDNAGNFRTLDNIKSYVNTFDSSKADVVSAANDTLTFEDHRYITGQRVTYNNGGGNSIGGLSTGNAYYVTVWDIHNIKLATNASNAAAGTAINLTAVGSGTSHTLNVAFDGTNTKFTATYDSGTKAKVTRAGQLQISVNGVIQQPNDNSSPTNGFGIDSDAVLIFSTAPSVGDDFWGYAFADVSVVHNGQLTNYWNNRRVLENKGMRFMSECDSELIAVFLAERMRNGATLEEGMKESLTGLDGVFTYFVATKDSLGMAKDTMAAKPLVLYESDDLVAMGSEEIAIRSILPQEIDTYDPFDGEVKVWQT